MINRLILSLFCLSLALPVLADSGPVGRVIFVNGEVHAIHQGKTRVLKRGAYILEGDEVRTGQAARTQIRMNDGALFALRPNTTMHFENYRYNKKTRLGSSLLGLIKGGFRTITGLIGQFNKKRYRVRTSVATIGVRGTHFGLTLCQQNDCIDNGDTANYEDGLYGSVVDGEIVAQNDTGEFTFSNDEYFHISSITTKPRPLLQPPGIIFGQAKLIHGKSKRKIVRAALKQTDVIRNVIEQKQDYIRNRVETAFFQADRDGNNNINLISAKPGTVATATLFADNQQGLQSLTLQANADNQTRIYFNAGDDRLPLSAVQQSGVAGNVNSLLLKGQARASDIGRRRIAGVNVGWGRWGKNYLAGINGTPVSHRGALHYATTATTTTSEQLLQLASQSVSRSYVSVAGTRPTDLAGNQANSFATVNMTADFASGGLIDYQVSTTVNGVDYTASGNNSISNAISNGIDLFDSINPVTGQTNTGLGKATLNFVGPQAEGAISSFTIDHFSATLPDGAINRVNGAVILQQQ